MQYSEKQLDSFRFLCELNEKIQTTQLSEMSKNELKESLNQETKEPEQTKEPEETKEEFLVKVENAKAWIRAEQISVNFAFGKMKDAFVPEYPGQPDVRGKILVERQARLASAEKFLSELLH